MNPKAIYDHAVDRNIAKRMANFLDPYLRDTLGDFEPRLTAIGADFNHEPISLDDLGSVKYELKHIRVKVELQCVPNEPIAKVLAEMVEGHSIKMLDDDGNTIVSCTLGSLAMAVETITSYVVNIDFFGRGLPAIVRAFKRVYETARTETE